MLSPERVSRLHRALLPPCSRLPAAIYVLSRAPCFCRAITCVVPSPARCSHPSPLSSDRKDKDPALLTLGLPKVFVSGAKRGFSDVIDGSEKWVFSGGNGSEVELGKGGGLFSPRGEGNGRQLAGGMNTGRDAALASEATGPEKKGQFSSGRSDRGAAHAANKTGARLSLCES